MNDYIKQRRAKFAEQLKSNALRDLVRAMMVSEDDVMPLPVVESLFNRCDYDNKDIHTMLFSGFYGPLNRAIKYRRMPQFLAISSAQRAKMDAAIDEALAGSNLIQGYTDQGLPSDPNGKWPGMRLHGEVFNDWGGGPGGHAGAKAWREAFMAGAAASTTSGGS